MLANQLARRGVRTLLVDRHAGPARETRALGVQARTLEIYAHLGIVERALELGKRGTGANLWAQGRRKARVPLGEAGRDVTHAPQVERRRALEALLARAKPPLHLTPVTTERKVAQEWLRRFEGAGLDGVVAKRL